MGNSRLVFCETERLWETTALFSVKQSGCGKQPPCWVIYLQLKKVKAVPKKYQLSAANFNIKLQLRSYNIELEIYRDLKTWDKGILLIEKIQLFLMQHQKIISDVYLLMLWYQFAYIYFMANDFDNALKWVNEIINRKFDAERKDLESYARLLNLMIHFELGNVMMLKYSVDNTRRWLRKQENILNSYKRPYLIKQTP